MDWNVNRSVQLAFFITAILTNAFALKYRKFTSLCPYICTCSSLNDETNCENVYLTTIPDDISDQVKYLNLAHNTINEIPQKLSRLHHLQTLILAHNQIKKLDKARLNISSLQTLGLQNNIITWNQIKSDCLNLTISIRELDLSYNTLGNLSYPYLRSNSLEILKMIGCSIVTVPKHFLSELKNLKDFIVADNKHLKSFATYSNSLILLDLSNCNLEHVKLTNFPELKTAYLQGNRISFLYAEDFQNNKLEKLDLSDNGIKFVREDAFDYLPELKILNISINVFIDLSPKTFIQNQKLKMLLISRTYLKNMVNFNISSLTHLDLSINEIQEFNDDSLVSLPSLQTLILSRNLISKLPNQIKSHSLRYLDLNMCQLTEIKQYTLESLTNLDTLDLTGNRLTSINTNYLPKSLKNIYLNNNLWRCECYSKEFKQNFDYLVPQLTSREYLICHSPENVSTWSWDEACGHIWYKMGYGPVQSNRMWMYIICMVLAMSLIFCVTLCIRRMYQAKLMREQAERLRQRMEAQERINRLRREQQESIAQQNAPDPRELVGPPSYLEAISMPRLDSSYTNISGSRHSLAQNRQSIQDTRTASNPDLSKSRNREHRDRSGSKSSNDQPRRRSRTPREGNRRRRRRRSQAENSGDFETQSVPNLEACNNIESARSILLDTERTEGIQPL